MTKRNTVMNTGINQQANSPHNVQQVIEGQRQTIVKLQKQLSDLSSAHGNLFNAHMRMRAAILRYYDVAEYSDPLWPSTFTS